jgi:hypothetical protein
MTMGENSLFMLTMQGLTLLKNVELFAKKMDCDSLLIHSTHLISNHPTSFCLVMSMNVSREWYFPSYEELLDAIGEVVTGIESETLTAVFERWMERLEWGSKNNGDYYP